MPSPFPGMDPFIEGQKWKGFHTRLITALGDALMPQLRPRYVVDVEEHVYLVRDEDEARKIVEPDVSIADTGNEWPQSPVSQAETVTAAPPVVLTLPVPFRVRQHYLVIRTRQWQDVVTVIEVLSPWNKTAGDGHNEYLNKRQNIFATPAHLVELDLLRGGTRLPTVEPLPAGDYYAFVCRTEKLPKVAVYPWSLRDPLSTIPIPLSAGDPDAELKVQSVFDTTYDHAGYDYALDYQRAPTPPLNEADAAWIRDRLKKFSAKPEESSGN